MSSGRGKLMGIVKLKNLPGLRLTDLLRRKKTTLTKFMNDFGISTYEGLKERCERIGVSTPSKEQFESVMPKHISSPTEGVLVLEPLPEQEKEAAAECDIEDVTFDFSKKSKKKKVAIEEKIEPHTADELAPESEPQDLSVW